MFFVELLLFITLFPLKFFKLHVSVIQTQLNSFRPGGLNDQDFNSPLIQFLPYQWTVIKPSQILRKMLFSQSVTQAVEKKKTPSIPSRRQTYDLLITSPDALPLSYRRLKGFKVTKLGNSTFFSEQTFHFGCLILNYLHGRPEVFLWVGQSCFLFMHDLYSFDMIVEYCSHFNVIKICF